MNKINYSQSDFNLGSSLDRFSLIFVGIGFFSSKDGLKCPAHYNIGDRKVYIFFLPLEIEQSSDYYAATIFKIRGDEQFLRKAVTLALGSK